MKKYLIMILAIGLFCGSAFAGTYKPSVATRTVTAETATIMTTSNLLSSTYYADKFIKIYNKGTAVASYIVYIGENNSTRLQSYDASTFATMGTNEVKYLKITNVPIEYISIAVTSTGLITPEVVVRGATR